MKNISIIAIAAFFSITSFAQNVGIGTTIPAEKLDVNGNINVTGSIKANGVDGTAGQVLMKNTSGNLAWTDIGEFKNHVTFITPGSSSWTVPAGVTRIGVEAWGGGGGASSNGGGGGGGYVTSIFTVTPAASVSYTVGTAGTGGSPGISGGTTTVSFNLFTVIASGGTGDNSASTFEIAPGGGFSASAGTGYYGSVGESGTQNKFEGYQLNSTTYRENQSGGKGGDGGNTLNTGGKGSYLLRDGVSSSVIYAAYGGHGRTPGGGGGSSGIWGGPLKNGAQGMVIIHY